MTPYISVVVPTTRVGGLDVTFSTLEMQEFKEFELIIVDSLYDRRKDLVAEKAKQYSFTVKHISQPDTGCTFSQALNNGVVAAGGQIMYILPDYTWLKSDCLQLHADFHRKKKPNEKYAVIGHFNDCALPKLHKDFTRIYAAPDEPFYREKKNFFLEKERDNFNNYQSDVNSGKLDRMLWSIFDVPFTTSINPNSFQITIPKNVSPAGIVDSRSCICKNESYAIDTILEINGWNEKLDGSHGWADWEFADRLTMTTDTKLYYMPEARAYTINPRPIMYARYRERGVFSNEAIWEAGVKSGFKDRVNNYSLKEKRQTRVPIDNKKIKRPYITVICPTMRIGGLDTVFESLENQTFKDFELIISDSLYQYRKDIVAKKANKYSFKYKHIAPISDKFPIFSQAHAENSAIVQAEGEVILFVTDYRYFMPWSLQMHADFHRSHPDNVGYAPGSKFMMPAPMKKDIPLYGRNENYGKYIEDLKSGKLDDYMWSIFDNNIFSIPQNFSNWEEIDRVKIGYDPKTVIPKGTEVPPNQIFTQSESVKTKIVLAANGFNEALDGAFNYVDIEFAYRLRNMFDFKWIGDNTNVIYRITGGDWIINKAKLVEEVQNRAKSIFEKYENGSKEPVNDWNLAEVHATNTGIVFDKIENIKVTENTKEIIKKVVNKRETTQQYFGRSFKIVDWYLIPGNNGSDDPWKDEEPIRQKYWNSFKPGEVVIDIGACFGIYTLPALMQGCRVIAFEPNMEMSAMMSESVALNGWEKQYQCHHTWLWNDTPFPQELMGPGLQWCNKDKHITTTLNDVTLYLDRVDMIKIDTEGAEAGIIAGAHETIKKHRPTFLIEDHTGIIEYADKHNTRMAMLTVFDQYDYRITVELFGGPAPPGGGRWFMIATPKEKI